MEEVNVKIAFRALMFIVLVNVSVLLVEYAMGPTITQTPISGSQVIVSVNATEMLESWSWTEDQGLFGDVQSGLLFFWNQNVPFVENFFSLMEDAGAPSIWLTVFRVPWRVLWLTFLFEALSGRNITDD